MITLDNQGRLNISKYIADEIGSKVIYLHWQSISRKDCLILSSRCESDLYMIVHATLDNKHRFIFPRKVLDLMGWTSYDSFVLCKNEGFWKLFKL